MTFAEWTHFLSLVPLDWSSGFLEIVVRKFQAVYVHGLVAVLFWAVTLLALFNLRKLREAGVPPMGILFAYALLVGFVAPVAIGFNAPMAFGLNLYAPNHFPNSGITAPGSSFLPSMFRTWFWAALPLLWPILRHRNRLSRQKLAGVGLMFPLVHSLLTLSYVMFPYVLIP
jgi:hypothetical protein